MWGMLLTPFRKCNGVFSHGSKIKQIIPRLKIESKSSRDPKIKRRILHFKTESAISSSNPKIDEQFQILNLNKKL
jgi:hypothetical protein